MSEREAFLQAIAADENDTLVRLVFADWLDEHGEYEEAEHQRQWVEAKTWLETVCRENKENNPDGPELTYDQLLDFGRQASAITNVRIEAEYEIPGGYNVVIAIRDHIPEFWRAWSIVTGLPLGPDVEQKYYYLSGYCCPMEVYPDTHLAGPIPEEVLQEEKERARQKQEEEELLKQMEEDEQARQKEEEEQRLQQGFDSIQDDLEKDRP